MKKHYRTLQVLAVAVGLAIGISIGCAHTYGQFRDAVVTCTQENSNNAAATAAVLNCLTNAVAGNYAACLAGLVTEAHWTVDEVACVVRRLSNETAQRLNAGTASGNDQAVLDRANAWIRDNNVRFR